MLLAAFHCVLVEYMHLGCCYFYSHYVALQLVNLVLQNSFYSHPFQAMVSFAIVQAILKEMALHFAAVVVVVVVAAAAFADRMTLNYCYYHHCYCTMTSNLALSHDCHYYYYC